MTNQRIITIPAICALLLIQSLAGYARTKITVFHAGSLSVPFAEMEKSFEADYPQYDIVREPSGSRECARKITEIGRKAEIMASADYEVIDNLLIPEYAKFNTRFAVNKMVLAYTEKSRFASEITADNWYKVIMRKGVKTGHSNPNLDPCGYRAVLSVKLAENFYHHPDFYKQLLGYGDSYQNGEENRRRIIVRPKETDLLALLEVGALDYFFIYRSVASQHNLKFIELPPQINLGSAKFKDEYKKASFRITGKKPGEYIVKHGSPMVYGITIIQHGNMDADKAAGAAAFVKFVISKKGQAIMKKNGQPPIVPPITTSFSEILSAPDRKKQSGTPSAKDKNR
jgi:molybdate/tungstate transport system substrate-binding protein